MLSSRRIDHDYALYLLLSLPEEHAVGKLQAIRSRSVSSYSKVIVSLLFYLVNATSLRVVCRWGWQTMGQYGRSTVGEMGMVECETMAEGVGFFPLITAEAKYQLPNMV